MATPASPPGRGALGLPSGLLGRVAVLLLVGVLYYGAGKLGLALAFIHASASAVWPPTAIALAAFLLLGRSVWPAILGAAFLVNVTTASSTATSAGIACGNTLEGLVGAWLVERWAGGAGAFHRTRGVVGFVVLAAGLATTLSATLGVGSLCLGGFATWGEFRRIWFTWWLGDATGALVLAPPLILWGQEPRVRWSPRHAAEALGFVVAMGATALFVFGSRGPAGPHNAPVAFLCLPFALWAAFRFGPRAVGTTAFALSAVAVAGTLHGYGPFVRGSPNESLLLQQAFMAVLSTIALITAAVVHERREVEQALRAARAELERRVAERTESLSRTVTALRHEVAERLRVEQELRTSELRLRELLEAAPDAMVIADPEGMILQVTAQAEVLFGFTRDEMVGQPIELLVPEPLRPRHREHREAFLADSRARPMGAGLRLHGRRKDGSEFPVEISLSPALPGGPPRVLAAIRDITERTQMERRIRQINLELEQRVAQRTADLERSNESLRQFAYVASHDLREPLRTVSSFAKLLARRYRGRLDRDADEFIEFIVDGARWMHDLLEDLLAYSRVGTGPWSATPTDCDAALDLALENLRATITESAARITRSPLPVVLADQVQVVQLFQNLVGNAVKFRRADVTPRVHVEAGSADGAWVFTVRDNGIGIDPEHAERVFGIFQRLHRRDEYPGTGVGLAICRRIVERHGGRMWVEPAADGGSVFTFTLPRREGERS